MKEDLTHRLVQNERGQTAIEYLMLLALAFTTTWIVMVYPVAQFTSGMIQRLHFNLHNMIATGELNEGQPLRPGTVGHPSDPRRFKPLHLR